MTTRIASTSATDEQPLPFLAIAQVLTCVNIFVELYILVVLVLFGVRTRKLCVVKSHDDPPLERFISMPLFHLLNVVIIKIQFVIADEAIMSSLSLSYNTTASNAACEYLNYAGAPTYLLSISATSLLVWYRQRNIYSLN